MKNFALILTILIPLTFAFTSTANSPNTSCQEPTNVAAIGQTSSSVTYDWDDCACSSPVYQMFYVKDGNRSSEFSSGSSDFTFSGLSAGTYRFYFYTTCVGASPSIIVEDLMDV